MRDVDACCKSAVVRPARIHPQQQKPLPKERLLQRTDERELLGDALEEDRELVEFDVPALTVLLETVTTVAGAAGKGVEA